MFTTDEGVRVLQCLGCELQFAEVYPDIEEADCGIYGDCYFKDAIEKRSARERIFEMLVGEMEQVLGRKGRLLDIGCGEGLLVDVAGRSGWKAEGTEISSAMIRYAREERGLEVHQGVLEEISLEPASFDAVVLNHVLEHVKDPGSTLTRICDLLSPDGVVRIEVPNLGGLSSRIKNFQSRMRLKRNKWKHYSVGHHFWFFTPETLTRTVRGAGLHVISLAAPAGQWDKGGIARRASNALYETNLLGGHLILYAGRQQG